MLIFPVRKITDRPQAEIRNIMEVQEYLHFFYLYVRIHDCKFARNAEKV